ncbi:MAG: glycosyltransferase family 39 protein [Chloroflexi bacterium]|nr:glycosyltransferase family 39 protein [Chloroflexota bacterium]
MSPSRSASVRARTGSRAARLRAWVQGHNPWLVLTTLLSGNLVVYVSAWVYFKGLEQVYADAATHLNLARRVFDSLTPGLGQVGAYWLPLVHLAELPFVWNDFLWRSGLAGTLVSALAYLGAVYFTFRLGHELTGTNSAAVLGALVMALNPNLLLLSAMPMFEAMLLCTWTAAIFYALRWARDDRHSDLILCSFWTLLATLVRHDNWVLLPGLLGLIVISTLWLRKQGRAKLESNLILFGVMALFGVFLYLIWNQTSYGDPLWFLHPDHRSRAVPVIAGLQEGEQLLPNLLAFPIAAYNSVGGLLVLVALLGLCDFVLSEERTAVMWAGLLTLTPFVFFTAMVFQQGESWVLTQQFDKIEFNQRYGLDLLPAAALFVAYLGRRRWPVKVLVGLVALLTPLLMVRTGQVVAYNEPTEVFYRADNLVHVDAGSYLGAHYKGGKVLLSNFGGGDVVIMNSGLDNREFITESNQTLWFTALDRPETATWVIKEYDPESGPNIVNRRVEANPEFHGKFVKVYGNINYSVYVRRDAAAMLGLYAPPVDSDQSTRR